MYEAIDGSSVAVTTLFLDEVTNQPLAARAGYPIVRLLDADNAMLSSVVASPSQVPGEWQATVAVPNMALIDPTLFKLRWRFVSTAGDKTVVTEQLLVQPKTETRRADLVTMAGDVQTQCVLPLAVPQSATVSVQMYFDNVAVLPTPQQMSGAAITRYVDRTAINIDLPTVQASLYPMLLRASVVDPGAVARDFTYKLWSITPQIALGVATLEDFLNKSRVENTIPSLAYNQSDLVGYLERGLYMFNTLGNVPSYFDGTNMQGTLFEAWIVCSTYYALGAQLLAEGSLTMDFSGQGVNLNIDRTPQLDAALGRIESALEQRVVPLKKQLSKQGIVSGDGSIGKQSIDRPTNLGILCLTNSGTTRIRGVPNAFGRRY